MRQITNPWAGYVDRTYTAIKQSVLKRLDTAIPEWTSRSPSDLFMIIVDMFAGIGEMINYYIDAASRELYLTTAKRLTSVLRIAALVGYIGKGKVAAFGSVRLQIVWGSIGMELASDMLIPVGTQFRDSIGNIWETTINQYIRLGYDFTIIPVRQWFSKTASNFATSSGLANQSYALPSKVAHGTLSVTINGTLWEYKEFLGFSYSADKHFSVAMKEDSNLYVIFGDGTNGLIPTVGETIAISYKETEGALGLLASDSITTVVTTLPTPNGIDHFEVNNPQATFGGANLEGIEDIRRAIPLAMRTLYRAVTKEDYRDITILSPGVRSAYVTMDCGVGVTIYVIPWGSANPNQSFLDGIQAFLEDKSIVSVPVIMKPAGETIIFGKVIVKSRYGATTANVLADIKAALTGLYNPYLSGPNQAVRSSDIISVVDNLPSVDYLTIPLFYAQPYLKSDNIDLYLEYRIKVLTGSYMITNWELIYHATTQRFDLFKDGLMVLEGLLLETEYTTNNELSITLQTYPNIVAGSCNFKFTTYPPTRDIELMDGSVPIITEDSFEIEII